MDQFESFCVSFFSNSATISAIDQTRLVTFASIAGVTRKVWCIRLLILSGKQVRPLSEPWGFAGPHQEGVCREKMLSSHAPQDMLA